MSFWTGFGTGLAKSVDQGLQKAMSKRDDELSRAKTFWQTRQAQKLDQKEAYDSRAEKALLRLIRETGSSTLGLAAFNAAGGDADGAEDFLKQVDATRNAGETYNIRENLNLPKDYKAGDDIEESAALKSVRMTLKGVDESMIGIDDSMARIGLGLKGGAVKRVADSVNSLIEPEIVETLNNIPNVTIDRSGFVSAIDRQREIENSIPGLDKQMGINTSKIVNLDKTSPTYETELEALEDEQAKIILAKTMAAKADEAGSATSGTKLTEYLRMSNTIRTDVDDELGYTAGSGGTAPSITSGPQGELSGDAAVAYRNKILARKNEEFVRNNLVDENGEPVSADAEAAVMGKGAFRAIANRIKAEAQARKEKGDEPPKPKIPTAASAGYDTEDKIKGDLSGFVAWKVSSQPTLNTLKGLDWMSNYLTGLKVSPADIAAILDPMAEKINATASANAAAQKARPKYNVNTAPKAKQNAPIALNKLTPGTKAHGDWIATYGKTHNPDGTPK